MIFSYVTPIKNGQRIDSTYSQIARGRLCSKRLAQKIQKIVIRREKSLIADSLPGKDDNIIFCKYVIYIYTFFLIIISLRPTTLQLDIYKRVLTSDEYQTLKKLGQKCDCGSEQSRSECCYTSEANNNKETKKMCKNIIF